MTQPTKSQRLMMTLLKSMTVEDLAPVLQYSLCDYHQRLLAVALIFPETHACEDDTHRHSESEEDELAEMLERIPPVGAMQ